MIRLRPAEDADSYFFWHLRREIQPELQLPEHEAWWKRHGEYRFVALDGPVAVGVIRLSGEAPGAVVSLQVAGREQCRGFATQMLTKIRPIAQELGFTHLTARVAWDNRASQRAFLGAGAAPTAFTLPL